MGFPLLRSIAALAAAVLAAVAVEAWIERGLLEQSGLVNPTSTATSPMRGGAEWRGYIIFPSAEPYRLRLQLPPEIGGTLDLDGRRVIEASAVRREARVHQPRGLHGVRVTTVAALAGRPKLLWAAGDATPTDVPAVLMVPDVVSGAEVRRRILIASVAPYAPFACSLLLLGATALGAIAGLRRLFGGELGTGWAWAAVAALFATGISWGLPDGVGWAPDELNPAAVRDAIDVRFGAGWATLYPPFHFAMFAMADAPFHLFLSLGLGDFTDLKFYTLMYLAGRGLSVLMALGVIAIAFGLGREIAGRRAGVLVAATLTVALPLAYYAKFANLDVPYVFWMALSMVFYARALREDRAGNFYLFTCAGTLAVCTKDQAYGFYVLPALYMACGRFLPGGALRPGVPTPKTLAGMVAIAIGGVAVLQNVLFNPMGFVEHLRILAGPGSESFRMFPATLSGQAQSLGSSMRQMGEAMSWPLWVAALCGAVAAVRTRTAPILWLLLPAASYYLTVIAVVGYHYDRFFLGVVVLTAIAAGWWLDQWTRAGRSFRGWRVALVAAAFVYALARVVALDVLMLHDSRYFVENWVIARASASDRVVAAGMESYLPRRTKVGYTVIPQDVEELEGVRPDYIIVNPGYSSRRSPGSRRHELYESLRSDEAGYELALRHRTWLWWSPLNLEDRFSEPDHDQFSNLTKINPLIEVYRRRATRTPATSSFPPPSTLPPTSR